MNHKVGDICVFIDPNWKTGRYQYFGEECIVVRIKGPYTYINFTNEEKWKHLTWDRTRGGGFTHSAIRKMSKLEKALK